MRDIIFRLDDHGVFLWTEVLTALLMSIHQLGCGG
jgi:hypothetical protein